MANYRYTLLVLFMLFISGGCSDDFLEIRPIDAITADNFYGNESQMNRALNGAYSPIGNRGMFGWWLGVIRTVRGDNSETVEGNVIAHNNFTVNDTDIRLFNRNNGDGLWNSIFFGILRCNLIIVNMPTTNINSESVRNRILGQALFLRALYNFYLVDYWNQGPLILENNYNQTDIPLSNREQFYAAIENDLNRIIENQMLPWQYDGSPGFERGRASMASAYALLGKVYLFQEKYQLAFSAFQEVINSNLFDLLPVNHVWTTLGDNGVESIFEVQFKNDNAGPNPFFDDGVNAAEITLRNQTIAPNQYNGWENAFPSSSLVQEFEEGDLRRPHAIVLPGEFFPTRSEPFEGIARNRGAFAIKKGMNSGFSTGTPNGTGEENFPIIRYADVLLMAAEALIRSNQQVELALEYIDIVRTRAFGKSSVDALRQDNLGISTYAQSKGISLFEALKHERRVELCFEGHRYSDLVRWGDLASNQILIDRGWTPEATYYPLSREDIDLSSQFGR